MSKTVATVVALAVVLVVGIPVGDRLMNHKLTAIDKAGFKIDLILIASLMALLLGDGA